MFGADDEKETSEGDSSCAATIGTNPTPGTEKDLDFNGVVTEENGNKVCIFFFFGFFFLHFMYLYCILDRLRNE